MPEVFENDKPSGSDIGDPGKVTDHAGKEPSFWRRTGPRAGSLVLLGTGSVVVVWLALSHRGQPARCPDGREPLGHRCCWIGQRLDGALCSTTESSAIEAGGVKGSGRASRCHVPYIDEGARCLPPAGRIAIPGGTLTLSPNDWQAEGQVARRTLTVSAFWLDATEFIDDSSPEPFLPLTGITAERADALCEARGGRLPTVDEWIFAAAGSEGRKYPWGQTGLVCRRAAFGLISGPCGFTETPGPEAVASRPDGKSPEGVFDLIGNVAEWARLVTMQDAPLGEYRALGGSFRSELASELKVWSQDAPKAPRDDVGFRCAYDK